MVAADESFRWDPPTQLLCFEQRKGLKGGASMPVVVGARDKNTDQTRIMVLKFARPGTGAGNHYEETSLAVELICAVLARALDLPVLDYGIVEIPAALLPSIVDPGLRARFANNIGENFGSLYKAGFDEWDPRTITTSPEIPILLEQLLTFDATVINYDRRLSKTNLLNQGNEFYLIDHSLALPVFIHLLGADPNYLTDQQIRDHCSFSKLQKRNSDFVDVLERWVERITHDRLRQLRTFIPGSWQHAPGQLDTVFKFLEDRTKQLTEVRNRLRRIVE